MFFYGIMYLIFIILILAITSIVIATKFMATIILSIAPIMIPFLIINSLRGYFFSWFKLFLSYSLFAPIAMVVGNFPMQALDKVVISMQNIDSLIQVKNLANNVTQLVFKPLGLSMVAILGIIVLVKVPSWVNQVLGTQNNDEVGLSPLKATAGVISRAGVGTIASRMGGASWLRSAGSGIAQAIPGGKTIGQAIGSKQSRLAQEARDNKQLEAMNRVVQAVEGYYK